MGCDIHSRVQVLTENGWETVNEEIFPLWHESWNGHTHTNEPFTWRCYGMFGFLADVRNYSHVPPISEARGLPPGVRDVEGDNDWVYGDHSFSWLGLKELLDFNYDAYFEDRRCTRQEDAGFYNGAADAGVGNGRSTTFREFLGEHFFADLEAMKALNPDPANIRVVFGFDD